MHRWTFLAIAATGACGVAFERAPDASVGGTGGSGGAGGSVTVSSGGEGGTGGAPPCRALRFDGVNDLVVVDDHPALDLRTMTIEAWIMPESYPDEVHILSHHDHDAEDGYVLLIYSGSEMQFRMYRNSASISAGFNAVPAAQWHHVAATCDGDWIYNYVDGAVVHAQQVGDVTPDNYAGFLAIGRAAYTDGFHFSGIIDEVRLSNVARYSGNAISPPTEPFTVDDQTVALWHFDGEGQAVADAKGEHPGRLGLEPSPAGDDPKRVDVPCIAEIAAGI